MQRLRRQHLQAFRQWLVEHRLEQGLERLFLGAISGDPLGIARMPGQVRLDCCPAFRRQDVVDIGVQFVFVDCLRGHRTTLRLTVGWRPSMTWRGRSRPRDRRDITVPTGMPSKAAMSA